MPAAKSKQRSSGRVLRWLRRARPVFMVLWAGLIFLLMEPGAQRDEARGENALDAAREKLDQLENRLIDLRFRWRGFEPPHPDIVVVAIDRPIISEMDIPSGIME